MKRSKQCPKCQSLRIGHMAFQIDANKVDAYDPANPRIDGHGQVVARTLGLSRDGDAVRRLLGTLEAYVCTACGFHETYVQEPARIEWTKLQGFSWVNPEPAADGPFR